MALQERMRESLTHLPDLQEHIERWWLRDETRYGLPIPDDQLQQPGISEEQKKSLTKQAALEREFNRSYQQHMQEVEEEWVSYIKKNGGDSIPLTKNDNLKRLVRKGIPAMRRPKVWFECSGAAKHKKANPGLYRKLLEQNARHPAASEEMIEEIEMDIARTFKAHPFLSSDKAKGMLRRILVAYTRRDSKLGYCQNMTYITAVLLLFLPEEDAFWLLVTILEDILPKNFCSAALIGLRIDQKVLDLLINEKLPSKIHAHLDKNQLDLSTFSTGWLLRLFVNVFPFEVTMRIWDMFLFEGSKILFRVSLAFLKLHEEPLYKIHDVGELLHGFNERAANFYDADRLLKAATGIWNLSRKHITELRNKVAREMEVESAMEEVREDDADDDWSMVEHVASSSASPSQPSLSGSVQKAPLK